MGEKAVFNDVKVDSITDADGGVYAEGVQQADITTVAAPAAVTAVNPAGLTATNPDPITAAAGEATAADLTGTQALEAVVSALVVDLAAVRTQLIANIADHATLRAEYAALVTKFNSVRTALDAFNITA